MKGTLVTVALVSRDPKGGYNTAFVSETTPGRLDEAEILQQLSRHTKNLLKKVPGDHTEVSVSHSVAIVP